MSRNCGFCPSGAIASSEMFFLTPPRLRPLLLDRLSSAAKRFLRFRSYEEGLFPSRANPWPSTPRRNVSPSLPSKGYFAFPRFLVKSPFFQVRRGSFFLPTSPFFPYFPSTWQDVPFLFCLAGSQDALFWTPHSTPSPFLFLEDPFSPFSIWFSLPLSPTCNVFPLMPGEAIPSSPRHFLFPGRFSLLLFPRLVPCLA